MVVHVHVLQLFLGDPEVLPEPDGIHNPYGVFWVQPSVSSRTCTENLSILIRCQPPLTPFSEKKQRFMAICTLMKKVHSSHVLNTYGVGFD